MDITRNWRLKTSRSQLMASRCPVTGEIVLPHHSAAALATAEAPLEVESSVRRYNVTLIDYAQAAR